MSRAQVEVEAQRSSMEQSEAVQQIAETLTEIRDVLERIAIALEVREGYYVPAKKEES